MNGNEQQVFPITQYYVQNVEVPMTLEAGAQEFGVTSVTAKVINEMYYDCAVPFVGGDGMFIPTGTGYVIKDYIEEEDRMKVDVYGDLSMQSLSLNVNISISSTGLGKTTLFMH